MALHGIIIFSPQIAGYKWTDGTAWNYNSPKLQAISGLMALRGIITLFPQITGYKWTDGTAWNYNSVSPNYRL